MTHETTVASLCAAGWGWSCACGRDGVLYPTSTAAQAAATAHETEEGAD